MHARVLHVLDDIGSCEALQFTLTTVPPVTASLHSTVRAIVPTTPSTPVHERLQLDQSEACHRYVAHAAVLHGTDSAPFSIPAQLLLSAAAPLSPTQEASRRRSPPPHCAEHSPHCEYAQA